MTGPYGVKYIKLTKPLLSNYKNWGADFISKTEYAKLKSKGVKESKEKNIKIIDLTTSEIFPEHSGKKSPNLRRSCTRINERLQERQEEAKSLSIKNNQLVAVLATDYDGGNQLITFNNGKEISKEYISDTEVEKAKTRRENQHPKSRQK